jgi:hypothetical protein
MSRDAFLVIGNSPELQRSALARLFNDRNLSQEGRLKIRAEPQPTFHGQLFEHEIPKWIAWNLGSWFSVRGIQAPIGITKFVFPTPAGILYDMNIVVDNKGYKESYRILVNRLTVSVRISIITLTETSGGANSVSGPFGSVDLVQWTCEAILSN